MIGGADNGHPLPWSGPRPATIPADTPAR
jgi:hypothetical protein